MIIYFGKMEEGIFFVGGLDIASDYTKMIRPSGRPWDGLNEVKPIALPYRS